MGLGYGHCPYRLYLAITGGGVTDGQPTLTWIQRNGKYLALLAVVGTGLAYVLDQVNPTTVQAFKVQEALKEQKTEIRWCLNKVVWSADIDRQIILRCAD